MTRPTILSSVLLGAVSGGLGALVLKGVAALLLGIIGAAGGYIFHAFIKPKLDKLIAKIKKK